MQIWLFGLAFANPPAPVDARLEAVRTGLQYEVVPETPQEWCSAESRAGLWAIELLCRQSPTVTRTAWRAPGRDPSWTVTIDTVRFSDASALQRAKEELVKLTPALQEYRRPDGLHSPTLSWCPRSYAFFDDAIVIAKTVCGGHRPYCAVTSALMAAAEPTRAGETPLGIVGFEGGEAVSVPTLATLSTCTKNRPGP